jgi:AcrR family transcriptional regulator
MKRASVQHRTSVRKRHLRERNARRQAIVEAATTVFAEHGLEGATIEMVAREATVAVGTIYLYFCSRDDLFLSMVAERLTRVRDHYVEIRARKLDPMAELRAMTRAYLDYLGESRRLFMTELSVAFTQLGKRLRRKAEIDNFKRVMALGREMFDLWEKSVGRVYDAGLIRGALGKTRTAAVLWASLHGAFMLTGDEALFSHLTGLSAQDFVEETLNFQLASQPITAAGNGNNPAAKVRQPGNGQDIEVEQAEQVTAAAAV